MSPSSPPSPPRPEIPTDTIVALSTARGHAALAVIRLSGERAGAALEALSGRPPGPHGALQLRRLPGVDEVMAVTFRAPRSYTGEDMVEIHCHGAPVIVEELITLVESLGIRRAGPGEFTYRAVLHGKMDLLDAERINARINAGSRQTLALLETSAGTRELLTGLLEMAWDALADLESDIEFEEGEGDAGIGALRDRLGWLRGQARLTARNASLPVVLLYGPPNCGKSTLFNAVVGYDRALVSDTPGTTRDYIEAEFYHNGTGFRLVDAAGVRSGGDALEAQGMDRTEVLRRSAAAIIAFGRDDGEDPRVVEVTGKIDTLGTNRPGTLGVSGVTGQGLDALLEAVAARVEIWRRAEGWDLWISDATAAILEELHAIYALADAAPLPELKAHHLRRFTEKLRHDIDQPPTDLYDRIFSRFCIGK